MMKRIVASFEDHFLDLFLLAVLILLPALFLTSRVQAQYQSGVTTTAVLDSFGYESITVSSVSIGFTSGTIVPTAAPSAQRAICTTETQSIRIRYDGTDPTASEGHLFLAASTFQIDGINNVRRLRMIRTGSDATVKCTYLR